MANNNEGVGYARNTQHDPDAALNSMYKPLWNRIMDDYPSFDQISLSDLRGENSLLLFTTFANRMAANPPVSLHTGKPFIGNTLKQCVGTLTDRLWQKFQGQSNEDLFPTEEVARWKQTVKDGHNRNLMEGDKESDLFKNTFPLPRKHSGRTQLFPLSDFENSDLQQSSRATDMYMICSTLIARERFKELAKILITFKCIG
jgi:hypothetical protein